jgi:hypothetical protein
VSHQKIASIETHGPSHLPLITADEKQYTDTTMIKRRASREEIEALAADGWKFRKKPRKDILYVSARRGPYENGLGRYSDEYWAMIQDVVKGLKNKPDSTKAAPTQVEAKVPEDPFISTLQEISRQINRLKASSCLHIDADRFCNYWHINELPEQAKQLNKKQFDYIFKMVKNVEGLNEWAINPLPLICDVCPAFIDERMIDFIKTRIKDVNQT